MANADRIIDVLRGVGRVCDDCLSETSGVTPRQQVYQLCSKLKVKAALSRSDDTCTRCRKRKTVNWIPGTTPGSRAAVTAHAPPGPPPPRPVRRPAAWNPAGLARRFGDWDFHRVAALTPDRDANGAVQRFMPQEQYDNADGLALHAYGQGPFCRFRLESSPGLEGVYAFVQGDDVLYVGECVDLQQRFNIGYGQISPRNCFTGGQPTNCRINALVLNASSSGTTIEVWFCLTEDRKAAERALILLLRPWWNR